MTFVERPSVRSHAGPRLMLALVAVVALGGCASASLDESLVIPKRSNEAVVRRYFEEWANRGNARAAEELIFKDLTLHHPHVTVNGLTAYQQSMVVFHTAFPDLHFAIADLVAQNDRVLARWTMTGTQRGAFQGQPATGRKVEVSGMSLFRIEDGKIREIWVSMDRLGFMQQLGLLPSPAPAK